MNIIFLFVPAVLLYINGVESLGRNSAATILMIPVGSLRELES